MKPATGSATLLRMTPGDPPSTGNGRPGEGASEDATSLLRRVDEGDSLAAERLLPIVYEELRARAGALFRSPGDNRTLQPTALVHEAYIKLIRSDSRWENRGHFCAIAARAMRQILLNYARDKRAAKRSAGKPASIAVEDVPTPRNPETVDLLALDDALAKLHALDEEDANLVELRYFSGLTVAEIAELKSVTTRTIEKRWRRIRAWLNRELGAGGELPG